MRGHVAPPRALEREEVQALGGLIALFAITAAWWALALWPMDNGPAWLERTRYVCFGVGENGLPDGGGWIGLIGGPLGMLLILSVGWQAGLRGLVRRARSSRADAATFSLLALGCTALIVGATARVQQARAATTWTEADNPIPPDNYPRLDQEAPRLALTAQSGATVDLRDFMGRPVLVTFAYAHCSTVCPMIVMNALRAQDELRGSRHEPALLIITLDPWRDTPSRLPSLAEGWRLPQERAWVLSGSVTDVEAMLDEWQVPRRRNPDNGEVTHPSLVYVVDRDGRIAYASTGGADALVSLLRRL